jgi:hypothetical protein
VVDRAGVMGGVTLATAVGPRFPVGPLGEGVVVPQPAVRAASATTRTEKRAVISPS